MAIGCRKTTERNAVRRMVTKENILPLINVRVKKILDLAELSLPEDKFLLFRKLTLNEFGKSGLEKELERVLCSKER